MCGLAGIHRRRAGLARRPLAHDRRRRPSRTRRRGLLRGGADRLRAPAAGDPGPDALRAAADGHAGRPLRPLVQRRGPQLPRAARRARGARPRVPLALGHRGRARRARSAGAPTRSCRFNGMFALSLWDTERRELLLARDRYGIKPMYVAQRGDTLLFGSEIKALLAHPALTAQMDLAGAREYLTFQNLFTRPHAVRRRPADAAGDVRAARRRPAAARRPRATGTSSSLRPSAADDAELLEELDRLLTQAVSRHLISDVPSPPTCPAGWTPARSPRSPHASCRT